MADPMVNSPAARLAATMQAAKKDQALRGSEIADRIERLTGTRPTELWVSRRLTGARKLLSISPDLFVLAAALKLDPMDLIEDAVRHEMRTPPAARRGSAS